MADPASMPDTDQTRIDDLVVANHVLFDEGVVDGFGHISVRSVSDPRHFFMARSALVPDEVTRADIIEYDEDSEPFDAGGRTGPTERFLHGEIYRARPDVQAVSHSHTDTVIPFAVTGVPLRALVHTASFLGSEPTPVFDIRDAVGPNNSMLVDSSAAGAVLATTLGERAVALMRGHGMTVAAPAVREAVFWSVYTLVNARIQLEALRLGVPEFLNASEVDRNQPVWVQWDWWAARAAARRGERDARAT